MKWWNIWRKWLTHESVDGNDVYSVVMPRLAQQLDRYNRQCAIGHIRLGTLADVGALVALEEDGYNGYLAWMYDDFKKDLQQNPYAVYLLLEAEGQIVAMISGRFTYKTAHISHLIVSTLYQRQGVGQDLLQIWCRLAQTQGIQQASLEVRCDNEVAQRLYCRNGFTITKEVSNYYNDGKSAFGMCCLLPAMKE